MNYFIICTIMIIAYLKYNDFYEDNHSILKIKDIFQIL